MTKKVLTVIAALAFCVGMQAQTLEAEEMTLSSPNVGTCNSPFQGVILYRNDDNATGVVSLTNGSGVYNIKVTGASSNDTAAGVALYVGGKKMADMSFSGTAPSVQQVQTKLYLDASSVEVKLNLENDNGSNDTYIDKIEFEFVKALAVRPTPVLPQQSVWQSGQYRNILQEAGYSQEEINSKLQAIKQQFFEGDAENGRLYYELGTDEAYILDTGNNDVRTESLSYGMMICVQLDMQTEFDKLWRFTKNHSMHKSGANKGYLAWQLNTDGSIKDGNAAPDGDEYIATALMFAAGRWGNKSTGIDYWKEANYILDNKCLSVFIHAPFDYRVQTIIERTGREEKSAQKLVKKMDKERRTYYEYFTDKKWKDITQYHLAFDSSKFSQDKIVEMIKMAL